MEFFNNAKEVRLQSHLGKYLQAADDQQTVRQTRNGFSSQVRWAVELVAGKHHVVRLKSCYGKYLAASEEPFMLGTAGKKVVQTDPAEGSESSSVEWEPRRDSFFVKLRTKGGKYLRANGGAPPWRNSVTHDVPWRTSTQDWVLWSVDVVDEEDTDLYSVPGYISPASSFSSFSGKDYDLSCGSPSAGSTRFGSRGDLSAMELFQKAKSVRLRSHHDKYLLAEDDGETVCQNRNGSAKNAKWTVEFVEHVSAVRFKSCYGKYLTASNMPFLLGMTGKKVLQTLPHRLDSSVEWEPIRDGFHVRLKTRYGQYLRANGGVPPWRNSITHDIPHRTSTQDWVLWEVDIVEIRPHSPTPQIPPPEPNPRRSPEPVEPLLPPPPPPPPPTQYSRQMSSDSISSDGSPVKADGRIIRYDVADEKGNVEKGEEAASFTFKGSNVEELKERLKEETGLSDVVVCSRNPLNGKLYPLRLHLPPNNADMHVVVVPSSEDSGSPESPS